ncbi:MAG: TonB-dependent receptor [Nitrospinota bacterium]|nr:TonB-dependent receptor [Nitrospinota bacterium]
MKRKLFAKGEIVLIRSGLLNAKMLNIILLTAFLSAPTYLIAPAYGEDIVSASSHTDADYFEMSLKDLMDIEVFTAASLIPTEYVKAPGTIYSFSKRDFTRLGVRRLDELLQFVPGIQTNQYRKRHKTIWGRGIIDRYNDKMILIVDGVQVRHLYYGHFDAGEQVALEKVEKVEIILGPASSIYGANAFGGIISITSNGFASEPKLDITLEAGDNDRGKTTLSYASERVQFFGSYLEQSAPYSDDRKSFIGGDVQQPLFESFSNFAVKVKPAKGITLSADYQNNKTPYLFIPDTQDAHIVEEPLTVSALFEHGTISDGRIEAKLFFTKDNVREYEIENVTRQIAMQENQNGEMTGANITWFRRIFDEDTITIGTSWNNDKAVKMENTRYWNFKKGFLDEPQHSELLSKPGINTNDYALFGQYIHPVMENLTLTLGGRYDRYEAFGDHSNYRGALVYTPAQNNTLKLMYGTAIRTPNYREYLKVLEGTDFVPSVPNPETMHTVEIGYDLQMENSNLAATLFSNSFDNYIRETPTPDGQDEYFANSSEKWSMHGLEMLYIYQLTSRFYIRLGGAYLQAERSEQGKLPYLAEQTSSFAINYAYLDNHNIGLTAQYNSARADTNSIAEDDPDAFTIVSLNLFGKVSKYFSYSAGIDNLADERVYDPAGDFGSKYNNEESRREIWARISSRFDL